MPFLHTGSVLFNGFESGQVHIFIAMLIILGIAILGGFVRKNNTNIYIEFNSRKNEWNKCKTYFIKCRNPQCGKSGHKTPQQDDSTSCIYIIPLHICIQIYIV